MRLFMTADAVGGVWSYALDLARGLAAHDVRTTLAVLGPPPADDQRATADAVPGLRLLATGLPLDWLADTPRAVEQAGAAVAALAGRERADLVHLNTAALAAGGARFPAPVVATCHSCVATWWDAVRGPTTPLPEDFAWRARLTARGYAAADALIAPTAAFAAATARAYTLPRPPRVVRNGRRRTSPLAMGLPPAGAPRTFALAAGRLWDEGKNIAALDRAAARLDAPVIAAGPVEGPNGARIRPHHLRTLGRLDEDAMARWLAAARVFVAPARYEPFGLGVLEAAQAGCALVLSDIPAFRELWNGVADFVPPDDDAALAAALRRALRDPAHRAPRSAAARDRAARYTLDATVVGTLAVYRSVLHTAPSQGEAA